MKGMLDDVLEDCESEHMVRFNVNSLKFSGGNINMPFQKRSDIEADQIASLIYQTMPINTEITLHDEFSLNFIHVCVPFDSILGSKLACRQITERCALTGIKSWIHCEDTDYSFAYALAILIRLQKDPYSRVRSWSKDRMCVLIAVLNLHTRAKVPPGPVYPHHYKQFQKILADDLRLVVVDACQPKGLLYKGDTGDTVLPVVYYNKYHFPMRGLNEWFGQPYYCLDCETAAKSKMQHQCNILIDMPVL